MSKSCPSCKPRDQCNGHRIVALIRTKPLHLKNPDGMPLLTRREEEMVHLVDDGLNNLEITERLKVKELSERNYLYRIFEKLGVSTWVQQIL